MSRPQLFSLSEVLDPTVRRPDETDEQHAERVATIERVRRENDERNRAAEASRRLSVRRDLANQLRLPPPVLKALVDGTVDDTEAVRHAQAFLAHDQRKDFRPVLGLLGQKGNGKSTGAGYALLEHAGEPYTPIDLPMYRKGVATTADEICVVFNGFSDNDERRREIMRADILIVEDVGTSKKPEAECAAFHEIIDGRSNRFDKLTVFTSNLSTKRLVAYLDDRTVDRLRQLTHWGLCFGKSMRSGSIPGVDQ